MSVPSGYQHPWIPDQGDGTYLNPVLHADYSDPDVIRVGDEYWMTASSFTATPGLPLLRSTDLVNWELVGHAIRQVPHASYAAVRPGCGVWAPSIREHNGRFWIFFPMPDEGIYATVADHPAGPWEEPWLVQASVGWIDPCPFWDDDGTAWLFHAFANSRAGKRDRLHVRPMSSDGRRLLGEGFEIVYAPHHPYLEGPKVHKRDGWYYVMAPGGGVPTGWQVAFRSKRLDGPYEERIVLARGSTSINGPHQGAFVDTPDGNWWFVHFQDAGPFGRITHLQPVVWPSGNDWPQVGKPASSGAVGEPVLSASNPLLKVGGPRFSPANSDEFNTEFLGPQWQWQANHDPAWADLTVRPGWLRLLALPSHSEKLELTPHLLTQKFPARGFSVETIIDIMGPISAGLVITGGASSACLQVSGVSVIRRLVYMVENRIVFESEAMPTPVRLRVTVNSIGDCTFGYADEAGVFKDFSDKFTAKEGGWMGAKVGLFANGNSGHADFDYFRFNNKPSLSQ